MSKITEGDLNEKVNVQNVEEFKMLSEGINTTVDALKNAIAKEAKRLDDELELAKNIQHSSLRYNGFDTLKNNEYNTLALKADKESYVNLVAWLENLCEQAKIPQTAKTKLQIAVEEIFVNIASYAYPPKDGDVEIMFKINDGKQVEMQFADSGIAYNPLETTEPDISLSAEERPIGGLGIFMVKKSMDYVHYEYTEGKNIFTIRMNF